MRDEDGTGDPVNMGSAAANGTSSSSMVFHSESVTTLDETPNDMVFVDDKPPVAADPNGFELPNVVVFELPNGVTEAAKEGCGVEAAKPKGDAPNVLEVPNGAVPAAKLEGGYPVDDNDDAATPNGGIFDATAFPNPALFIVAD